MRIKIKKKLNESMEGPEGTLPPMGSPPKPPGLMQKIKDFVRQFFDVLKAPFAKEMKIPEEEVQQHTMQRLISKGATPRVQAIIDRLKAERDQRTQEVADYLDSLTVANLEDEQLPMDLDDGYPLDMTDAEKSGREYYDPDEDPLGPLQEVARRHFPKR